MRRIFSLILWNQSNLRMYLKFGFSDLAANSDEKWKRLLSLNVEKWKENGAILRPIIDVSIEKLKTDNRNMVE